MEETVKKYGPYSYRLSRLLAFLGRYANQPVGDLMKLEVDDFYRLVQATGEILDEEAAAVKRD